MKFCMVVSVGLAVGLVRIAGVAQTATDSSRVFSAERGRHHELISTVRQETNKLGQVSSVTSRYAVLANGMNFTNASGQWQTAVPVVQALGDFVVCTGAAYRVVISANLNRFGSVDLETSDRQRIVSHPLAIGFYDPESGQSALLARLKDSRAELVSSNLIVFRDAFDGSGIEASITYAYRRGRFSQDLTFQRGPSVTPSDFGMSANTRLEMLTEIVESPMPSRMPWVMKRETDESKRAQMVEPDLVDEKLDYGAMAMYLGRAFSSHASKRDGIPVAKRLLNLDGRTVLSEAVEWRDVVAKLNQLPKQAGIFPKSNPQAALKRELPKRSDVGLQLPSFETRLARATTSSKPRMASLSSAAAIPRGFVLDYELVESATEFTFESGETYLVEDAVVIDGMATFEAGAVIKHAPGASLTIAGSVSGPSGTVTFTAKDDNSVGYSIGTGTPSGTYAERALAFYYVPYAYLGYLDIRFAETGLYCYGGSWVVYYSSFLNCDVGVYASSAAISLGPADMCNVDTWHDQDYYGSISPYDITECVTDRDGDGLPEDWELEHFGRLDQNGGGDFDSDGLSNLQEYQLGLNPAEDDTDGNGIADGDEDPDGDGLTNVREYVINTSPTNPDTGSTGTTDAYKDADADGLTNLEEFQLGKNPLVGNVASPNFNPVGGSYASAQNVTVTCPTAGATIRYTLNGDEPTTSSTSIASGSSVSVSSQMLKAKAWKASWTTSDTESQTYVIETQPPSNEAPTVTVSPSGSVSFLASDSIEILVEAEDADGTIAKVQLYRGTYKVAETTTSSVLRHNVANVPSGTYTFTAKAIDDDGAVTLSSPVTLTINASSPVISLIGVQPFFTSSPGTLIARTTGVNPGGLSTLTLNGDAITKRTGEFTIPVALTEGENTFTLTANGTISATTKVYLDSVAPVIAITAPANNTTFNTTRVNVSGTFTETSLKQITVNGVLAFISGNTFTALNVPLATDANTITATAEDIAGNSTSTSINLTGGATLVDPVQLAATPVGGFATLNVTFTPTASSAPGTLQNVYYDFDGNGTTDQTESNLNPVSHNYAAGEYFPVVTVQTTVGKFSSLGGWNSTTVGRLRINVQSAPVTESTITVTDPVDLKTTPNGHLYVLSRSTATVIEYDSSHAVVRSKASLGTTPTGLDVDANGNVYVALSGQHQVAKYNPNGGTFQLDTSFDSDGIIGSSGTGNGQFNIPYDVAVSPDGTEIAVSDSGNHRIQRFSAANGAFLETFGTSGSGVGQFSTPKGLTYDARGYLYIVDSGNSRVVLVFSSDVIGTSGSSGIALGQFQGPLNLSVGSRGIYVGETGNNRVQIFDPVNGGHGYSPIPFSARLSLSTQLGLSQPNAVASIADFLAEKIYIADMGNNRVIKATLPESSSPEATWSGMTSSLLLGNIDSAIPYFTWKSGPQYREVFLSIGVTDLMPIIDDIGTIAPVSVENESAQYYFEQEIDGVMIAFPINFTKENGSWRILDF
ncbi:MAG TPA: chitobiase/beta-hexosaminidase C-terminal domain-containing protein [Verrucomicrobiae bacterium]|nr:chitobiase/beta-hexosaminidase C-terminal domain-containing protein [Verrucomicrobiae bacterium]